jgi:hypothetical protein
MRWKDKNHSMIIDIKNEYVSLTVLAVEVSHKFRSDSST